MSDRMSSGARMLAQRLAAAREAAAPPPPTPRASRARRAAADAGAAAATAPDLPDYVVHVLARWQLLHDVGFRHLVPDSRLLPPESARFFTLDPAWTHALVSGALAAGGTGSRERAQVARAAPAARLAARENLRLVREVARGRLVMGTAAFRAAAAATDPRAREVVTGVLVRSAAVSGWPGLQVRAWTSDAPADVPPGVDPAELAAARPELVVPLLRMDLLAPSVLLVLFQGTPALVWMEEPHHAVQLGLEEAGAGWAVPVRDSTGHDTGATVAVPMRPGPVAGVVDVAGLAAALDAADPLPAARGSAGIALSLLQAPSRQRFGVSTP